MMLKIRLERNNCVQIPAGVHAVRMTITLDRSPFTGATVYNYDHQRSFKGARGLKH